MYSYKNRKTRSKGHSQCVHNKPFPLQVIYAVREYARRAVDILARRTRMAFLNVHTAEEVLPRIIEIMSQELKWSKQKQKVSIATCF